MWITTEDQKEPPFIASNSDEIAYITDKGWLISIPVVTYLTDQKYIDTINSFMSKMVK